MRYAVASAVLVIFIGLTARLPASAAPAPSPSLSAMDVSLSSNLLEPDAPASVVGPGLLDAWDLELSVLDHGKETPRLDESLGTSDTVPPPANGAVWLTAFVSFTYSGQAPLGPLVRGEDFTLCGIGPGAEDQLACYALSFSIPGPAVRPIVDVGSGMLLGFLLPEAVSDARLDWHPGGLPIYAGGQAEVFATWAAIIPGAAISAPGATPTTDGG